MVYVCSWDIIQFVRCTRDLILCCHQVWWLISVFNIDRWAFYCNPLSALEPYKKITCFIKRDFQFPVAMLDPLKQFTSLCTSHGSPIGWNQLQKKTWTGPINAQHRFWSAHLGKLTYYRRLILEKYGLDPLERRLSSYLSAKSTNWTKVILDICDHLWKCTQQLLHGSQLAFTLRTPMVWIILVVFETSNGRNITPFFAKNIFSDGCI